MKSGNFSRILRINLRHQMRRIHLIFGIIFLIIFLITGRFMRLDFPDKDLIPQDFRLLMRSRHIYILLSSFIHISIGLYLQIQPQTWRKYLQIIGSVLLLTGTILLISAFFYETYTTKTFTDISRFGLYSTLGGIILHFFGRVWTKDA
jgi:di/tricarboxylate transporter